jgi:hypothetical protein
MEAEDGGQVASGTGAYRVILAMRWRGRRREVAWD